MHRARAARRRRTRRLPGGGVRGPGRGRHRTRLGGRCLDRRDQRRADRRQPARASRRAPARVLDHRHRAAAAAAHRRAVAGRGRAGPAAGAHDARLVRGHARDARRPARFLRAAPALAAARARRAGPDPEPLRHRAAAGDAGAAGRLRAHQFTPRHAPDGVGRQRAQRQRRAVRQPAWTLGRAHRGVAHPGLGRAAAGLCRGGHRRRALLGRRPGVEHAAGHRARRRAAARHAGLPG